MNLFIIFDTIMNYCPQNQPIVFLILMFNGLKKQNFFNLKYIYYEYNHHNNYL